MKGEPKTYAAAQSPAARTARSALPCQSSRARGVPVTTPPVCHHVHDHSSRVFTLRASTSTPHSSACTFHPPPPSHPTTTHTPTHSLTHDHELYAAPSVSKSLAGKPTCRSDRAGSRNVRTPTSESGLVVIDGRTTAPSGHGEGAHRLTPPAGRGRPPAARLARQMSSSTMSAENLPRRGCRPRHPTPGRAAALDSAGYGGWPARSGQGGGHEGGGSGQGKNIWVTACGG